MLRREFIKTTALLASAATVTGGLNSCVGTYHPKIINAIWNEKFVFDAPNRANRLKQLILCGVMAPSGHNTQPWFFKIDDNKIEILPDYSRVLPIVDPFNRELFISLGAVLENILTSAPAFGFLANYHIDDTKRKEKIIINLKQNEKTQKTEKLQAMIDRQTTRNYYTHKQVPADLISYLQLDKSQHTGYFFSESKTDFDLFLDYIKSSNNLLYGNKKFLDELKKWIRWNDSEAEETLDGLYIRALGESPTPSWFGKMMFNLTVTPKTMNDKEAEYISTASGLLFLFSEDGTKNWIETGKKMQDILIRLTAKGMKYAFHNQPNESLPLRIPFAKDFGNKGLAGQIAIRVGWSESMPRSPRRRINDVIIS